MLTFCSIKNNKEQISKIENLYVNSLLKELPSIALNSGEIFIVYSVLYESDVLGIKQIFLPIISNLPFTLGEIEKCSSISVGVFENIISIPVLIGTLVALFAGNVDVILKSALVWKAQETSGSLSFKACIL